MHFLDAEVRSGELPSVFLGNTFYDPQEGWHLWDHHQSIFNPEGTYGNPGSSMSIWNSSGLYGSLTGFYSAFARDGERPPRIIGAFSMGVFLTKNTSRRPFIDPEVFYELITGTPFPSRPGIFHPGGPGGW